MSGRPINVLWRPLVLLPWLMLSLAPLAGASCQKHAMTVDGRKRTYLMHQPLKTTSRERFPLVIVLHGGGATAKRALAISDMCRKADKERFVVVAPNGTGILGLPFFTWNAGECCSFAKRHRVDDVGFVSALIDKLDADGQIDPHRVYVTGESNGGMMAYRLACDLSEKITAIAPVSACMDGKESIPNNPVSVMAFNGTADRTIRYDGGMGIAYMSRIKVFAKPAAYATSFWVDKNHCRQPAEIKQKGNIIIAQYKDGLEGSEVVLCTIKNGFHSWPGGGRNWLWARKPTREIVATDEMWNFFSRHSKPDLMTAHEITGNAEIPDN